MLYLFFCFACCFVFVWLLFCVKGCGDDGGCGGSWWLMLFCGDGSGSLWVMMVVATGLLMQLL